MSGSVLPYEDLITSEHVDKPKYMAMMDATCQPLADLIAQYNSFVSAYEINGAAGNQLDVIGQWVGVSRYLDSPLTGVYFAFDTDLVGFDEGVWMGPYDPATGLVRLPDDYYRALILARILNNRWDGSLSQAYAISDLTFGAIGAAIYIVDHGDLSITFGVVGLNPPDALVKAMLTSGKFDVKPAGVRIRQYEYESAPGPAFSFDLNSFHFGGFDTGGWVITVPN